MKRRLIKVKFWDDSYIVKLDSYEKLLYLYLMSNTQTNISGVYELTKVRIAFDTAMDVKSIEVILDKFTRDKKLIYTDGYMIMLNFVKNQDLNPSIRLGIETILQKLPEHILEIVEYELKPRIPGKKKIKRKKAIVDKSKTEVPTYDISAEREQYSIIANLEKIGLSERKIFEIIKEYGILMMNRYYIYMILIEKSRKRVIDGKAGYFLKLLEQGENIPKKYNEVVATDLSKINKIENIMRI